MRKNRSDSDTQQIDVSGCDMDLCRGGCDCQVDIECPVSYDGTVTVIDDPNDTTTYTGRFTLQGFVCDDCREENTRLTFTFRGTNIEDPDEERTAILTLSTVDEVVCDVVNGNFHVEVLGDATLSVTDDAGMTTTTPVANLRITLSGDKSSQQVGVSDIVTTIAGETTTAIFSQTGPITGIRFKKC